MALLWPSSLFLSIANLPKVRNEDINSTQIFHYSWCIKKFLLRLSTKIISVVMLVHFRTPESNYNKNSPYKISLSRLLTHVASKTRECAVWWTGNKAVFTSPYRQLIHFTANQNIEFSRTKRLKKENVWGRKAEIHLLSDKKEHWKLEVFLLDR